MVQKQRRKLQEFQPNQKINLEEIPLEQMFEKFKRHQQSLPKPFESPDVSPIKERAPSTIISHLKYKNPNANLTNKDWHSKN